MNWRTGLLSIRKAAAACFCLGAWVSSAAQPLPNRVSAEINSQSTVALPGSANPHAASRYDVGRTAAGTRMSGITLHFKLSVSQQISLNTLVREQQTPGSANYRKWLTPAQYASRFGLSDRDLAAVQNWLEAQGFTIDRISNSHNSIRFSGTVSQVESAFQTEIHNYVIAGETHYANATQISIPSALSGVILSVRNLDDFRPKPFVRFHPGAVAKPAFTSSESGDHYMQPGDVSVIYDVKAAYSAGYTGSGQSIAIVGQSEIPVSDVEAFQSAAGLTVKDPTMVLVPGSGTAAYYSDDEAESDLDVEYAGGIGTGATIYFVYVGNTSGYSVWDSLQYAVDTDIAPIISMSYGACEADFSSSDISTLESIMEQGASQGQSIIVASGDTGSTACFANLTSDSVPTSGEEELAVNYPASSAYVTAMGGTEFPSADVATSNTTYWEAASGSDIITSALSYIPEQVWNDDSATYGEEYGAEYALSAGGGGTSTVIGRPSWQTAVTGIASGSYRLVPDLSLDSSPNNAGYLYCTSDTSGWSSGQQASCNDGFRDESSGYLTVAGGTSFAAPIFAGMLALINQRENSTGQGLINPTLYTLAASSSTYASAFHDITSGGNQCTAGSTYCSSAGESEFAATTGYDEASGLGSVDLNNLMSAWTVSSSSLLEPTVTALSAAGTTPASGASDTITITVTPQSSSITATPTGTLTVAVDGAAVASALALSAGSATYTFSSTTSGSHVITATYSGDSTFAASTGTVTVYVGGSSVTSSFTLAATNVTVSQGLSGTSTITVTSENSYAGTVDFTLSTDSTTLQEYGCYGINDGTNSISVTANSTATASLTIYTSEAECNALSADAKYGLRHYFRRGTHSVALSVAPRPAPRSKPGDSVWALAGILLIGFGRRRRRLWSALGILAAVWVLAFASGCGNGSTSSSTEVPRGSYTLTLDGADSTSSSIASSTTLTLTVD